MNLLNDGEKAAYVDTGTWASKAIEAARQFGNIEVLASSKSTTYDNIPRAQKNLGPAGVTVVIIKKDLLGKVTRQIPAMLDYRTFIKEKSMYNTPPVYAIYVCMLTLRWIKQMGGLAAMEKHNKKKANILYKEIDSNPLFKGNVEKRDRSLMNVCFTMHNRDLEPLFAQFAKENGVSGIEGHRSVGGFRASIYNAMPIKSIKFLADLMRQFAEKHG
ncbi:phosphoserine aminotransferase [Daphnia sinensis]|uniref:phosphoserine transaminase n=1 Tax=Daphnia sinensis TaxID=1820382 RepID=A0AAD5KUR4_9CRUS|nr:phosphoserine aminotransferase [Daphnia sinensis]